MIISINEIKVKTLYQCSKLKRKTKTLILNNYYLLSKTDIIIYSDRRYFDGRIYEDNGFVKLGFDKPKYYYTKYKFRSQQFDKNKLNTYNPSLTEWENMQLNSYDRIWNCGNNIYIYKR